MKQLITLLAVLPLLANAATVTLQWAARPADEQINAYTVYQQIGGTWSPVGTTTNTAFNVVLPAPGKYTYSVAASNFWGEAPKSVPVSTPALAGDVTNVVLILIQR